MGIDLTGFYRVLDDDREFYRSQAENIGTAARMAGEAWGEHRQEKIAQGKAPGMLSWAGRGIFGKKEHDVDAPITKSEYLKQYGIPETIEQGGKQVATGNLIPPEGSSYEQFLQKTYGGDWKLPMAESDVATKTVAAKEGLLQKFLKKRKEKQTPVSSDPPAEETVEDPAEAGLEQAQTTGYNMSGGGGPTIQEAIDTRAKYDGQKDIDSTATSTDDPTVKGIDKVIVEDKGPYLLDKAAAGIKKFGKSITAKPGDRRANRILEQNDALSKERKVIMERTDLPPARKSEILKSMSDKIKENKVKANYFKGMSLFDLAKHKKGERAEKRLEQGIADKNVLNEAGDSNYGDRYNPYTLNRLISPENYENIITDQSHHADTREEPLKETDDSYLDYEAGEFIPEKTHQLNKALNQVITETDKGMEDWTSDDIKGLKKEARKLKRENIKSSIGRGVDKLGGLLGRVTGSDDLSMPQRQALQMSEKADVNSPDYVKNIGFELSKQSAPNAMRTVQFLVEEGRLTNEHLEELSKRFPEVMRFFDYGGGESVDYGTSSSGMYSDKGEPIQWANPGGNR